MEDEFFVFNPNTGDTHILNQLSWALLLACADQPRSSRFLIELVVSKPNCHFQEDTLTVHLEQLQQLGLLQTKAPS